MLSVIDIADAVAAELNAAPANTFPMEFTADRHILPTRNLHELTALAVTVVPKSVELVHASRSLVQYEFKVDVGVQKKIESEVEREVPELVDVCNAIASYIQRRQLESLPNVMWIRTEIAPVYASDHLSEHRVFTAVLTLTYRALQ